MSNAAVGHGEVHRDVTGGSQRAAFFGISDGLITNVSLILGFAGAHPGAGVVRLAGIAGLVAGAFSMASGEYLSMQAQRELFERELAIERKALAEEPDLERKELIAIYRSKGIEEPLAAELADSMMRNPELALETHAREELGIDPTAVGFPVKAAVASFFTFALGAFFPLIPWLFGGGSSAVVASIIIAVVVALFVGAYLGHLASRSPTRSALRQLLVAVIAASVTYGVGHFVGAQGL